MSIDWKTVVFFADTSEGASIFERKVWSECKNGEEEWGETLKNTTVRHAYIKFVQNYPFF